MEIFNETYETAELREWLENRVTRSDNDWSRSLLESALNGQNWELWAGLGRSNEWYQSVYDFFIPILDVVEDIYEDEAYYMRMQMDELLNFLEEEDTVWEDWDE